MSDRFVLDGSVTMAWFFGDEATPAVDGLLDRLGSGARALVAQHWSLEVGNTVLMAERRKRCTDCTRHAIETPRQNYTGS